MLTPPTYTLIFNSKHTILNEISHCNIILFRGHTMPDFKSDQLSRLYCLRYHKRIHGSSHDVHTGYLSWWCNTLHVGRGRHCLSSKHRSVRPWHRSHMHSCVSGIRHWIHHCQVHDKDLKKLTPSYFSTYPDSPACRTQSLEF